jgi:NitT/TauT family transport system substrate-binding protein
VNRWFIVLLSLSLVVGACNSQATPTPTAQLTPLTVGLGYIPSVQFAQFYRAQRQGYYRQAGLEVTFQNQIDPNLVTLVGLGAVDIGIADGTSVIPAVGQGIPIRYATTIYASFPNIVMVPSTSLVKTASDFRGLSIGIPGRYGSSWIMLQAFLASGGLTPDDVAIREYPDFGQAAALRQGQVDAATGFYNNEPIQLRTQGFGTNVFGIDASVPLPGPGLIVGESTFLAKRDALRALVAATLRAMDESRTDFNVGLDDAINAVPELGADRQLQGSILGATIELWSSPYTDANGRGAIDSTAWQTSIEFMRGLSDSNIPADLTADRLVTEDLLP